MQLFAPIFEALNRSQTRYVLVGGVATILHGYVRSTSDVDVVLDLAADNLGEALNQLSAIGYVPRVPVAIADFADPAKRMSWIKDKNMMVFSLRNDTNPVIVDVFVESPVDFEGLWERSVRKRVGNHEVRVASIDDLISMKRSAGRPQDLQDLAELEEIRKDAEEL